LDEDPEEAASFGPNGPYNGMPDPGSKININTATKVAAEQADLLEKAHYQWRGNFEQLDDILIGGYQIR
ncbi:MAG: hypothetical protein IIT32_03245, partial [Bacteroidales bacterium]|nr:hypothetical protein [Bacteroidales bacterium]